MKKSGKIFSIKIGGSVFPVTAPASDARIKQIEDFINYKFEEIKAKNPKITFSDNLVLALLHITDLLIDAEEKNNRLRNDILNDISMIKSAVAEISEFIEEKKAIFEDEAS